MYCKHCGKEFREKPNFCSECKKRLQEDGGDAHAGPSKSQTIQTPTLGTFLEYRKRKAEERQNFSCGKMKSKKICKVQINIGLMTIGKGGVLKPKRGKTISLSTHPDITALDLLNEAVRKMRDFNKDLDEGPFLLLYPDGSEVINIPGTQRPFTLKAYKEEIGKTYHRVIIFICQKKDFEKVGELPDTSDSDPEIVIKTTSREFYLADTLPFEPHHKSSPVHKEPDKVFKDGLASLEFLASVQKHPGVLAPLLCYFAKALTAAEIERLFIPDFSTRGSNRWERETKVIGFWADFQMECEDEVIAVSLPDVLMFATGLSALPPAGITPRPSIGFLNDSPFPMATTCSNTLKLPLLDSYSLFRKNMEFGIQNAPGFGCFSWQKDFHA